MPPERFGRIYADRRSHRLVTGFLVARLEINHAQEASIDLESRAGALHTGGGTDKDG